MAEQVADALERLEEQAGKKLGDNDDPLLVSRPLRRPRVDAGHARHGAQPRAQRRVGRGARQADRERALRVGLLPALRADVRQRRARDAGRGVRGRDQGGQEGARASRPTPTSTPTTSRRSREKFKEAYKEHTGDEFPQDPQEQLRLAIRAVFDSWTGERAVSYRRLNRIPDDWGTAVNVQQMVFGNKGDDVGHRRRVQPRRGDRRARAVGRLPRQRPGRGRGLGRAQHARHRRARGRHARGARAADGDPRRAREALQGHAGHRVHDRGRAAVHAADAQRQAPRPGGRALRLRRRRRGAAVQGGGAARRSTRARSTRCCTRPSTRRPTSRCWRAGVVRLAGRRQGRGRVHGQGGGPGRAGRARRDPRAAVHGGRRRRGLPRRQGDPHLARAARPRTRRWWRAGWAARRWSGASDAEDRPRRQDDLGQRHDGRGRRLHRHRRHQGLRDARGRAADRRARGRVLRPRARVGRRAPPPEGARQRRRPGRREEGARAGRRGHRPVPDRAHVHGRGPPAEDAGDDHGRATRTSGARRSPSCCRSSRRTSRGCSRRWRACR